MEGEREGYGGGGGWEKAEDGAGGGSRGRGRGREVTRVGGTARTYRINTQYLATQHKRQLVVEAMAGSAVGGTKVVFIL